MTHRCIPAKPLPYLDIHIIRWRLIHHGGVIPLFTGYNRLMWQYPRVDSCGFIIFESAREGWKASHLCPTPPSNTGRETTKDRY